MSKFLTLGLMMVLLAGCTTNKPRDVVTVTDHIRTCANPPKADKVIMRTVKFSIIKDEYGIYWIAVTPEGYKNLGINMQEIMQHIKQKNAIIKYYESCHKQESTVTEEK